LTPGAKKKGKDKAKKTAVPQPPANNVREHRKEAALRKVELARLAGLSDKTIQRVERMEQNFDPMTYRKIFNALNRERKKQDKPELRFEEVFPSSI
jgi:predicted transcriptional regulator